jgi:hypothetical protein
VVDAAAPALQQLLNLLREPGTRKFLQSTTVKCFGAHNRTFTYAEYVDGEMSEAQKVYRPNDFRTLEKLTE